MFDQQKQLLIGVITASASQSEQRQLLEGITEQAQKLGAATAVFSNIYNAEEYFAEVEIENKIYELIVSKRLDGLILTAECFLNHDIQQRIYQLLLSRTDIPIIVTGAELDGFPYINNDIESDLTDIVNHLIEVHGFTEIDLLTGHDGLTTSEERVDGYRKALEVHNIPFSKNRVIYGDFWMTSGEELAMEYVNGTRPLPQAIVCCNDYMAYGLCDVFLTNGIRIPEDVTVIGYEYVGERYYHAPILTTYQRNRRGVGAQALNLLWKRMTGFEPEPIAVTGSIVRGNTCPCGADLQILDRELLSVRREQYYSKLNLVGNFEQQLTLCRSIDDYVNVLQQFAYLIRDVKGLHLCLYENWCSSEISGGAPQKTDTMICRRIITNRNVSDDPLFFHKFDLFPDAVPQSDSGNILYFCPIFFSGKELGYFIMQYDHPDCYDIIFRDWLKIASNALEFLRLKNDIGTLLECRNLSVHHDSITGLYNAEGLNVELSRALMHAGTEDSVLLLLVRTELFFDNSSLDRQDLSVRMDMELAENLKKIAISKNTFCAKLSDKLFAIATVGVYFDEHRELLSDKLRTLITHAPLYGEHCSTDSLIICASCTSCMEFEPNHIISELEEQAAQKRDAWTAKRRHPNYKTFVTLRDSLYRQPQESWDAQTLCRDFHLSSGHFRAIYKELFDISFHQDVIRARIALAKHLLLTTALSLPAIAYKCGYEDDKYFLRQFRQLTGMTPNLYKNSYLIT